MEITVTGRHVQVSDRFRQLLTDKLGKVEQFAPRTQRVDVVVSHEASKAAPKGSERVEITCIAKGPVIRAEAYSDDKYTAMDLAVQKLTERLRRAGDRRKVRRRGPDLDEATADLEVAALGGSGRVAAEPEPASEADRIDAKLGTQGDSPVQVREKVHEAIPMSLDQALYEMELVGHDFFLFIDKDSDRPSVVYRRRGWDYGVISLAVPE
ncbi:Ribosome hibernation promotion factor [Austwickia sp. TVS 96-490-7B]|uniref:ribosome hibernation-promoting factor, HPF/YfiA family n=1 Tax=Austwickia sp. TVS 96-490-7B TaxID=2830843 RepID=UPI001C5646DA|nr:ribosome-associated translation inhibitor RaiA [Austwickia sp. TVS 96-490-7B]MBW3086789.1 Ribosome hibernation promotion factor [Austwickia sp. TVS 96-490-7B]